MSLVGFCHLLRNSISGLIGAEQIWGLLHLHPYVPQEGQGSIVLRGALVERAEAGEAEACGVHCKQAAKQLLILTT